MPPDRSRTASSLAIPVMDEAFDALIVGGGPAGATAALILAKAGWSVALIEKSGFPRRKVCGEFLSASNLPLLFKLGIGEAFLSRAGPPVKRVGYFAGKTVLEAPMPRAQRCGDGHGRALGREHLDLMLLEAAADAGAMLWQPCRVVALRDHGDGWTCAIEVGHATQEVNARIVIAATGSWQKSVVEVPGLGVHRPSDLLAFKARFRDCEFSADLMPLLAFPGGYGGMVHTDKGRVNLSCCIRRDVLRRCREKGHSRASDAVIHHIRESCFGVDRALRHAKTDGAWLAAGPIRPGIRSCYADGVFRIGNLAGEAHPIIAEGITMAMQSSWLLCLHLASGDRRPTRQACAEIGAAYAADWRRLFTTRIGVATLVAHFAMNPVARAAAAPLVAAFPGLLTLGAALSGKVREPVSDWISCTGA